MVRLAKETVRRASALTPATQTPVREESSELRRGPDFRRVKGLGLWLAAAGCLAGFLPNTEAQQLSEVFPLAQSWRYDAGCHDGDGWETALFNDSGWSAGPGGFTGGETSTTLLPILSTRTLPPPSTLIPAGHAMYFRTHFSLASVSGVSLVMFNAIDDGAVFYLNGTRILSLRGPAVDTCASLSTSGAIGPGTDALLWEVNTLGSNALAGIIRAGDNVLAVSVHQVNAGSSDMVFKSPARQ